jgi:hypothetical protein
MVNELYQALRDDTEPYFPGGFTLRDEANAIVAMAFRHGPIEDLHEGKDSELLHNPDLCRITQEEMKAIMINASRMMEKLLREKQDNPEEYAVKIIKYAFDYCRDWER